MIAQSVAPRLAGMTPGSVHRRHELSGKGATRTKCRTAWNVSSLKSHAWELRLATENQ